MIVTVIVGFAVSAVEGALSAYTVWALAWAAWRGFRSDPVEGVVLVGLMVLGAFCLVALDAARRGAGL